MARYLIAAGLAEDPEQGYAYAQAARRLAARIGVIREACGIAAYRTGRWAEALSELRAARRMSGHDDYLPVMADSERALGRLDRALALVREADPGALDRAAQIELRIVESGIRRDQGLADAAVLVLQVPELTSTRLRPWSARLFYAYADALLAAGRADEARDAFARAAAADRDGETDAGDRLDELDGIEFEDLAESDDVEQGVPPEDLGSGGRRSGSGRYRRDGGLPGGRPFGAMPVATDPLLGAEFLVEPVHNPADIRGGAADPVEFHGNGRIGTRAERRIPGRSAFPHHGDGVVQVETRRAGLACFVHPDLDFLR